MLLDMDGVLRRWPVEPVRALEKRHGLEPGEITRIAFAPDVLGPALVGELSDTQWRLAVAARLLPRLGVAAAASVVAEWSESTGEVDADVLRLVDSVRRLVPVVLVSNATTRLHTDLAALGLAERFAAVVSSAEIGRTKPDPAIFRAACEAAGVPAACCLFVDDDAGHVAGARRVGLRTHHFRDAAGLRRALRPLLHPPAG